MYAEELLLCVCENDKHTKKNNNEKLFIGTAYDLRASNFRTSFVATVGCLIPYI